MKNVDTSLHRYFFPNINEDGWKFVSIAAIASLVFAVFWMPLGLLMLAITIWCFYSFRDPARVIPLLSGAVVAPADGTVISITREKGPDALGLQSKNFIRICIYSSIFDVHITRFPIKAKVRNTFYFAGKKFSGSTEKNNLGNERFMAALQHSEGMEFILQYTAVFCTQRIISNLKKGDEHIAGQRCGFIRFGGYTDIFLPEKIAPQICVGQKTIGGETIIADIKSDAPRLEGETI